MIRPILLCSLLALPACQPAYVPKPPSRADLSAEILLHRPAQEDGACWAEDEIPAVIETVTEQVQAKGPDGATGWQTVTQQKIVQDRRRIWFRAPCEEEMTVEFIATLQRALKARGLYRSPVTGQMDKATGAAVRSFQAPLGLNSRVLSLAAARDMGIVAADLGLE